MKISIASIIGIVALIFSTQCAVSSGENANGAIHARVTANGLNYINQQLKQQLQAEVNRLSIPAIGGEKNRLRYEIKNIRIEHIVHGPSSIQSTNQGLRWQLSFSEIRVRADWNFRYKRGWVKISDDGNARATIKNLGFGVTLRPRTVNGKLAIIPRSVIPSNCASVRDIDVRIGGSFWAWLYNILIDAFEGRLRRLIPPKVCEAAGKEIEQWSREVFPSMKTSDDIELLDEKFLADYGLVDPQFQNGLANIRFRGEVFPLPKTFPSFPFSPSPMPSTSRSKHVYLVVSDYVANTLLYSAKEKGLARQTFSAEDDPTIRSLLEQVCNGIPGVDGGDSGNNNFCSNVEFSFDVLESPKMTFSRANGVALQLTKASVQIKSTGGNRTRDLLNILIDVAISAQPKLSADGRRVHLAFAAPQVNFDVIEPSIPPEVEEQTQNFIRMAGARYGRRALNKFGKKGIELPNVKGKIDIKDKELKVEDGALVVAANLDIRF